GRVGCRQRRPRNPAWTRQVPREGRRPPRHPAAGGLDQGRDRGEPIQPANLQQALARRPLTMSSIKRPTGLPAGSLGIFGPWIFVGAVVAVLLPVWVGAHLGAKIAGTAKPPANPFAVF